MRSQIANRDKSRICVSLFTLDSSLLTLHLYMGKQCHCLWRKPHPYIRFTLPLLLTSCFQPHYSCRCRQGHQDFQHIAICFPSAARLLYLLIEQTAFSLRAQADATSLPDALHRRVLTSLHQQRGQRVLAPLSESDKHHGLIKHRHNTRRARPERPLPQSLRAPSTQLPPRRARLPHR